MKANAIHAIINMAKAINRYNTAYIQGEDTERVYLHSSNSEVYFDDANEVAICLRSNSNYIRASLSQEKYEVLYINYDHIEHIFFHLDIKDIINIKSQLHIGDEDIARIIKSVAGDATATGWLRNNTTFNIPESNAINNSAILGNIPTPVIDRAYIATNDPNLEFSYKWLKTTSEIQILPKDGYLYKIVSLGDKYNKIYKYKAIENKYKEVEFNTTTKEYEEV